MKRIFAFFRTFIYNSTTYFSEYQDEISKNNRILLRKASVLFLVLLTLYGLFTSFLFNDPVLRIIYLISIGLAALFTGSLYFCVKDRPLTHKATQALCYGFIAMVVGFVILISVFPFPDRPAIFFPLLYLLVNVLFILPFWKTQLYLGALQVIFMMLCIFFKTGESISYDLFSASSAWILGFLFSYLILDLRFREYTVRKQLEIISSIDETTGLFNRYALNQYLKQQFAFCVSEDIPIALFMLDIDHFKAYNDKFGHIAGDRCLSYIGDALKGVFDSGEGFIARYGGEEFTCVLLGKQVDRVPYFAQKIMESIQECAIESPGAQTKFLTISIGIAISEHPVERSHLSLIRKADTALYYAKGNGRNQTVYYRPDMGLK